MPLATEKSNLISTMFEFKLTLFSNKHYLMEIEIREADLIVVYVPSIS